MTGPEDFLSGADGPRPLPADFRARLEEALLAEEEPSLAGLDGPRPLPPAARARIEDALINRRVKPAVSRRRAKRELIPLGAVAAVILLLLGVVAILSPGGGSSGDRFAAGPGGTDISDARLIAFDSCDELLSYLKNNGLERVTAWGLDGQFRGVFMAKDVFSGREVMPLGADAAGGGGAGTAAASTTNVQEVGVDEPDTVKTDGTHLFAVANGALQVIDAASKTLLATVPLANGGGDLLLEGDRLLVLGSAAVAIPLEGDLVTRDADGRSLLTSMPFQSEQVVITTYDVSNPAAPTVVGSTTLDGWLVAGRLSAGLARIVVGSSPLRLPFVQPIDPNPAAEAAALAQNKAVIEASTIDQWIGERDCREVQHPAQFSGFELLSVTTIDPASPTESQSTSLLAGGDTVYASSDGLYVATQRWDAWMPTVVDDMAEPPTPPDVTTQIHQFDISEGPARYVASGEVTGYLLSQWAMSEYEGNLRVASTNQPPWGGGGGGGIGGDLPPASESSVTVLSPNDGALVVIGSVGGLGHDQQIQGVRFIDDVGYVVTFRRTDPLYTIDLSDPTHPTQRGALEVTGYSAYLHPIGDGLLLGVGQDATDQGQTTGLQVSVFDVHDLDNPALASRASFPDAYSEAEQDHHAFLWWPDRNLAVVPTFAGYTGESSAVLLEATAGGVTQVGEVSHSQHTSPDNPWAGQVRRSVVIGDVLYTISDAGVLATDLGTLGEAGWVPF